MLGRHDEQGRLRIVGRAGRLSNTARAELADALRPPNGAHPWPATIPASRFGQLPAEPLAYTQVAPEVVVEVEPDTAVEHQRWRHARYRRIRADLTPNDLARQSRR